MNPVIAIACGVFLLYVIALRRGLWDPITISAIFYFYFAFGPVINLLLGLEIYFGTIVARVPQACVTFVAALSGICLAAVLPLRHAATRVRLPEGNEVPILRYVVLAAAAIGAYQVVRLAPTAPDMLKTDVVEALGGPVHYAYLLIQYFITACFFVMRRGSIDFRVYCVNAVVYVLYCVIASERDFVFMAASILLHVGRVEGYRASRKSMRAWASAGVCAALFVAAVVIERSRAGLALIDETVIASVLNQGSLLFVNTNVLYLMDAGQDHTLGMTYVEGVLSLLPRALVDTKFSLSDWLRSEYAPRGTSGYGFGLDAEAYLNFGYAGVAAVFAIVTLIQRVAYERAKAGGVMLCFSVFYTAFLMYAMRNESLALIKGSIYALIFFGVTQAPSVIGHHLERRRKGPLTPVMRTPETSIKTTGGWGRSRRPTVETGDRLAGTSVSPAGVPGAPPK